VSMCLYLLPGIGTRPLLGPVGYRTALFVPLLLVPYMIIHHLTSRLLRDESTDMHGTNIEHGNDGVWGNP